MQAVAGFAGALSGRLRNGSLQTYVAWLLAVVSLVLLTQLGPRLLSGDRTLLPLDGVALLAGAMLIVAAVITAILHRHRMTAIMSISVVGLAGITRTSAPYSIRCGSCASAAEKNASPGTNSTTNSGAGLNCSK